LRLVLFAAAFVLQALSNGYFLYFFAIASVVVIGVELWRPRPSRARLVADLTAVGGALRLPLAPLASAYLTVQREKRFERDADDLLHFGARLSDYLTVPPEGWTWGGLLAFGEPERQLFPGFVALLFAAVGVFAWRSIATAETTAAGRDGSGR